jgi:hypothetical protein
LALAALPPQHLQAQLEITRFLAQLLQLVAAAGVALLPAVLVALAVAVVVQVVLAALELLVKETMEEPHRVLVLVAAVVAQEPLEVQLTALVVLAHNLQLRQAQTFIMQAAVAVEQVVLETPQVVQAAAVKVAKLAVQDKLRARPILAAVVVAVKAMVLLALLEVLA